MTTRAHRRPARFLAVLALSAPSAALVVATATPALAATASISAPASNAVFAEGTSSVDVTGSATVARGESVTLSVNGPGMSSPKSYTGSYSCTSLVCPSTQSKSLKVTVSVSSSNANGEYTASLSGSGTSSTRHFYTNFKPLADPGNLAAAPNGNTEVDLSWSYSGSEPDKAGFTVVESHNGTDTPISVPASACNGSTCGYALTYPAPAVATTDTYSYTVTALRQAGCDSCAQPKSNPSASASAQLVGPPPPPSPTPTPTDGGTTGASTGGSTGSQTGGSTGAQTGGSTGAQTGGSSSGGSTGTHSGGTTGTTTSGSSTGGTAAKPITIPKLPPLVASRRSFALGFNHFSPSLGIPKLPPLPATTFPVTAGDESSGGVYQPQLPYKNGGKKTTSVLSSPIAAISDSIGLDKDQLMKLVALGLVLFAAAAHVRLFLSHSADD